MAMLQVQHGAHLSHAFRKTCHLAFSLEMFLMFCLHLHHQNSLYSLCSRSRSNWIKHTYYIRIYQVLSCPHWRRFLEPHDLCPVPAIGLCFPSHYYFLFVLYSLCNYILCDWETLVNRTFIWSIHSFNQPTQTCFSCWHIRFTCDIANQRAIIMAPFNANNECVNSFLVKILNVLKFNNYLIEFYNFNLGFIRFIQQRFFAEISFVSMIQYGLS